VVSEQSPMGTRAPPGTPALAAPLYASNPYNMSLIITLPVAAIGWSILYMILGGGIVGAIVIFIVAKIFRR
jgi:hypothetical protein